MPTARPGPSWTSTSAERAGCEAFDVNLEAARSDGDALAVIGCSWVSFGLEAGADTVNLRLRSMGLEAAAAADARWQPPPPPFLDASPWGAANHTAHLQ